MKARTAGIKFVTRKEWGARPPKNVVRIPHKLPRSWQHHSAGEFPFRPTWKEKLFFKSACAYVRGIQNYHMGSRGYADIAYTGMLFKLYGWKRMYYFVGRGFGVQGGHTLNENDNSYGFCLAGNFDIERLSKRDIVFLRRFYDWVWSKEALGGKRQSHPTGGHRDAPGAATGCPGTHVQENLPKLRQPWLPWYVRMGLKKRRSK